MLILGSNSDATDSSDDECKFKYVIVIVENYSSADGICTKTISYLLLMVITLPVDSGLQETLKTHNDMVCVVTEVI
jgi:hypothetical protein